MKKTYIAPNINICLVETENLVAVSFTKYETGGGVQLVKDDNTEWDIWTEPTEEDSSYSPFE